MKRAVRLRRRTTPDTAQTPPVARTAAKTARVVERLIAAETARVVPSDAEIDDAATITESDIDSAVSFWDEAQAEAGTGLGGLLDAQASDRD